MNKQISNEEVEQTIYASRKAGIRVKTCYIYVYPGETLEDLRETASFITKIAPKIHRVRMYPFAFVPGTPLKNMLTNIISP